MSEPFNRQPTDPTESDYLAYLIDECNLNDWQRSAFPSMLKQLMDGERSWLSEKQAKSVMDAVKFFGIKTHKELYRGYAEETRKPAIKSVKQAMPDRYESRGSTAHIKNHFDDYDDDIPF